MVEVELYRKSEKDLSENDEELWVDMRWYE